MTDFPSRDVTDERQQPPLTVIMLFAWPHYPGVLLQQQVDHEYAQTLHPAEPWSPGTHGNRLSTLAPGLHHSNARGPQLPDVTFPADPENKDFT